MADLSGTWLGTYWQNEEPTRFEASLIQAGNSLSGNILDDNFLGEAELSGEVVGKQVQFSKRYLSAQQISVNYIGTLNDNENIMKGIWKILGTKHSGYWEARCDGNDLMLQLKRRIEQQVPVGAR